MSDLNHLHEMVPAPRAEVRADALKQLRSAIADEATAAPAKRHWAFAAAMAAIVLISAVGWLVVRIGPSADAALERLATAVEQIPAEELPDGAYHYTRSEQATLNRFPADILGIGGTEFALVLPETRETWIAQDGSTLLRITVGQPHFFDPTAAETFRGSDLSQQLGIGTTATASYPPSPDYVDPQSIPTDLDQLNAWIRLETGDPQPSPAQILDTATQLLTETGAPPELRAAVLRVLARTDGLQVQPGTLTYAIEITALTETGNLERTVLIDHNGHLQSTRLVTLDGIPDIGVPPNTILHQANYQPTTTVTNLPSQTN